MVIQPEAFSLWAVLTGSVVLERLLRPTFPLPVVLLAVGLAALAVAPLATAPLALHWNRVP